MDTFTAINTRRAIKQYDPDHEMPEADLTQILTAAIQSPTSYNIQHWRFVVVKDRAQRERVYEVGKQAQMRDASVLIIMTADKDAWKKDPKRYWSNAPTEIGEKVSGAIIPFYEGREWLQRDEAQRSIGMAMQTIMLAATAMGYQSCPMIGFDIDKVAELIKLPDDHVMGPMIAIGRGTKDPRPKPGQLPLSEVVIENHFG